MNPSNLLNRTCTITRKIQSGAVDELGNATKVLSTVTTTCEIQQRRRDETEQGEWSQAEWAGFFPTGTLLDAGDSVAVSGLAVFEVVGMPWGARNPRTRTESHVEATLSWTAGAGDTS